MIKEFKKNTEIKFLHIFSKQDKKIFDILKSKFKHIDAAGGLVINKKSQILVIKRNGTWDLPKGKVEKKEKLKIAAIREVEEECGISDLEILKKTTKTYHTYILKGKEYLKTTHWYLMNYKGIENLIPQTEENITEVKWVDIDKLDEILLNTYSNLIELFEYAKNNKFE
ncbi:MAG: NUDIX domain-containing protein [Bacteroidales bacterium]|nr:NUDIX domain-containing protein [Bacteroidales bacterium]MBN2758367.1 NUDIX domain-containing protein [Bacteroidales bacterium]